MVSSNSRTSSVDLVFINSFLNSLAPRNPRTYILKKRRSALNGRGSNTVNTDQEDRDEILKIKQFLTAMLFRLFFKANGIIKNTTPHHNPIHTVLISELQSSLTVGISPLIVSSVSGAIFSRSFLISGMSSQCASTSLISFLVRR